MYNILYNYNYNTTNPTPSYNSKGDALGTVETPPPPPTRLQWELQSEPLVKALDTSYEVSQKILNDVDLRILMYTKYGKGEGY